MDNEFFIKIKGDENLEKAIKLFDDNNFWEWSLPDFTQYSKEDFERWDIIILDNK